MNTIEAIKAIGELMTERGWDKNGAAGAVKRDKAGKIIAKHGSPEFFADFDDARETLEARAALAELVGRPSFARTPDGPTPQPERRREPMPERINSIEDEMRGVVRYRLDDGRQIELAAEAVRELGAIEILRRHGHENRQDGGRVDVIQDGKKVGSLPADFDPHFIKSRSFFYDPRPGDFRKEGNQWVAARMLGPGDLEAVPGFQRTVASPHGTP